MVRHSNVEIKNQLCVVGIVVMCVLMQKKYLCVALAIA